MNDIPDRVLGEELGDMFLYSGEPAYDGGDASLLKAAFIQKVYWIKCFQCVICELIICSVDARCMFNDKSGGVEKERRLVQTAGFQMIF